MRRYLSLIPLICLALASAALAEGYPTPSPYPIAWELNFTHALPQRIVVQTPADPVPQAYWFLPYTVTNNTDREQTFLPVFEMLTEDGQVIRSDKNVPLQVFEAIKKRLGNSLLEQTPQVAGTIRIGEDQARDGVAIWREPMAEMGRFSIFVGGLSGEAAEMKSEGKESIILRKTLQLNYLIRGDEVYPGEDEVNEHPQRWIMR